MFRDLAGYLDDPQADAGFVQSDYLILAPEGETADMLVGNIDRQAGIGAETRPIMAEEARARHPLLDLAGIGAIGYEPRSGYADPSLTTASFIRAARARAARARGVTVMTGRGVGAVLTEGDRAAGLATGDGPVDAGHVVLAIGPWTRALTDPLGIETHLDVSRHTVLTLRAAAPYGPTTPVVKELSTAGRKTSGLLPGGPVPPSPTVRLGDLCYVSVGIVVHVHERRAPGAFTLEDVVSNEKDETHPKPFVEGKHLDRWLPAKNRWLEWGDRTRASPVQSKDVLGALRCRRKVAVR